MLRTPQLGRLGSWPPTPGGSADSAGAAFNASTPPHTKRRDGAIIFLTRKSRIPDNVTDQ